GVTRVKVSPLTAWAGALHPRRPRPRIKRARTGSLPSRHAALLAKEYPRHSIECLLSQQHVWIKPWEYTRFRISKHLLWARWGSYGRWSRLYLPRSPRCTRQSRPRGRRRTSILGGGPPPAPARTRLG